MIGKSPRWLRWAERIQAIAQTGLAYSRDPYDRERYAELRELAVEMAAAELGATPAEVRVAFASGVGYPTPKVDVRAVVFREGRVLLVREAASGRWTLPGGWADVGEGPSGVAEREAFEESGYRVRAEKVLGVLDKARHEHPPSLHSTWKMLILCRLEGGEARPSHETDAADFFAPDALPDLDLDRTTPGQLALAFSHLAEPERRTDFD